jgi:hypothetical protein
MDPLGAFGALMLTVSIAGLAAKSISRLQSQPHNAAPPDRVMPAPRWFQAYVGLCKVAAAQALASRKPTLDMAASLVNGDP